MKGRLWTGRIYDWKKIRESDSNKVLICVMRWPPRYISLKKNGILHLPDLAPSTSLLKSELSLSKNWGEFVEIFLEILEYSTKASEDRFRVRSLLLHGEDVVLLCHEPAGTRCHRRILPNWLLNEDERDVYHGEVSMEKTIQTRLEVFA